MRFSAFNPIRFIQVTEDFNELVDWGNTFPNGDNQLNSHMNFGSNYPACFSPIFLRDSLKFQLQSSVELLDPPNDISITAFDLDGNTYSLGYTVTLINPTGWVEGFGYESYNYEVKITPTSDYQDDIQFKLNNGTEYWISEPLKIHGNVKDHIKIEYSNSENDFAMIFDKDGDTFSYKVYIEANNRTRKSGTKSVYDDDRGSTTITRSTTQREFVINVPFLPSWLLEKWGFWSDCDNVKINDVDVTIPEDIEESEFDPYFNGFSASLVAKWRNWDYRDAQSVTPTFVISDDNKEVLTDDNDEFIKN